ncbi:hypothetical protein BD770DRAFT_461385, partial [Pilaira anomala]
CNLVNWLYQTTTKHEFSTRFITPSIDLIKRYLLTFEYKPGEQKLLMVESYENSVVLEEDSRLPGPNIDGIIRIVKSNLDFVLVEISGLPCAAADNNKCYKRDRNKIENNSKYMFNMIISKQGEPCFRTITHLKLFAFHFYSNIIYVCSLSIPIWDVPVLRLETEIKIPVEATLFTSTVPKFVSKLFSLGEKINLFAEEVKGFLCSYY